MNCKFNHKFTEYLGSNDVSLGVLMRWWWVLYSILALSRTHTACAVDSPVIKQKYPVNPFRKRPADKLFHFICIVYLIELSKFTVTPRKLGFYWLIILYWLWIIPSRQALGTNWVIPTFAIYFWSSFSFIVPIRQRCHSMKVNNYIVSAQPYNPYCRPTTFPALSVSENAT